jgi:hypothetical protein
MSALRDELTRDPEALGYAPMLAAGSHNVVAAALNERRYPADGPITIERLLRWAAKYSVLPKLEIAAANTENIQIAGIAKVGLLIAQKSSITELDLGLEDVQQMFAALVAAGVISADERDELFAAGVRLRSRADLLGLGTVTADDVSRAVTEV